MEKNMRGIDIKYGFPIFMRERSTTYIVRDDNTYVSDIWSFWYYIIRMQGKKEKRERNKHIRFLNALLDQAHYFYISAEQAPFKAKPLLYYYAFMNIAKVIINMDYYVGTSKKYMHGVECLWKDVAKLSDAQIRIKRLDKDSISISYQLMRILDTTIGNKPWPWTCSVLSDLFSSCVGIHRTYSEVRNLKESFLRLDNIRLEREGKNLFFNACIHDCCDERVASLQKHYNIEKEKDDKGKYTGQYVWRESIIMKSYFPTRMEYYNLAEKIREKGIWYLWSGNENVVYISDKAIHQTTECIIYNIMFVLGSIARYQPYKFDELLSDKEHWMIGEFLQSQPKQFLYLVTSKMVGAGVQCPSFL